MKRSIGSAAVVAAFLLTLLVGASSAYAVQSVRTAATTATSTNVTMTVGRSTVRCGSFAMGARITSTGGVTIPAGGAAIGGCTVNGLPAVAAQTLPWTGFFTILLIGGRIHGVSLDVAIPSAPNPPLVLPLGGLRFTTMVGCTFDVAGGLFGLVSFNPTVTPPMVVVVNNITLVNAMLSVVLANGAGCAALGIVNGANVPFLGNFALVPAIQATLV